MNGVFQKMLDDQARTQPAPIDLSIDLVVPEDRLFLLGLDELRKLDQRMFEPSPAPSARQIERGHTRHGDRPSR